MFIKKLFNNTKKERLAEYAHDAWSGWMKYLFSKCDSPIHHTQGGLIIPQWAVERWKRQMNTSYKDLPEKEKKSDRKEAEKIIDICCGD